MSRVSLHFGLFRRVTIFIAGGDANRSLVERESSGISGSHARVSNLHPNRTTRRQLVRAAFVAIGASIIATGLLPAKARFRQVTFHDSQATTKDVFFLAEGSTELTNLELALKKRAQQQTVSPSSQYYVSKWEAELATHYATNLDSLSLSASRRSPSSQGTGGESSLTVSHAPTADSARASNRLSDPPSLISASHQARNGIAQTTYDAPLPEAGRYAVPVIEDVEFVQVVDATERTLEAIGIWKEYWEERRSRAAAAIEPATPSPSDHEDLLSRVELEGWKQAPRPTWHILIILGIALTSFGVVHRAPVHTPSESEPAKLPLYSMHRVEVPQRWVLRSKQTSLPGFLGSPRTWFQIARMIWVEAITTIMLVVWICW